MPRGRPKKKIALEDLPGEFSAALVRLMAKLHIGSVEDGLIHAAIFLDSNTKEFNKLVNSEAEQRYRSRHFTELNKTLDTREKTAYNRGYYAAKRDYRITFPCSVCGKPVELHPNDGKIIEELRTFLRTSWRHTSCNN